MHRSALRRRMWDSSTACQLGLVTRLDNLFVRLFTLTPVSHSIRTIFLIPFKYTKGFEEL